MICEYGCGRKAKYKFKNGKWCCSKYHQQCSVYRKIFSEKSSNFSKETREKLRQSHLGEKNHFYGKTHNKNSIKLMREFRKGKTYEEIYGKEVAKKIKERSKGKTYEEIYGKEKALEIKKKQSLKQKGHKGRNRYTIRIIKIKYSFFSQIEELRYNPDKPEEKEIQAHCKNHKCPNSKEKGGWFTPTYIQLYERIRHLENENGNDGAYLYCSDECKQSCPLYHSCGADPFTNKELPYTQEEKQIWNQTVLEQDNYTCQYCGSKENLHCHHIIPVKLEPMLALDPDNGIVLCEDCHYKIGHKTGTECSTRNLRNKVCNH
jgi:hypothetical protein